MPRVLGRVFTSARSILGQVTVCILGKEGEQTVILLGGGTKQRQQNDIKLALERWDDYKQRKKQRKETKEE
jgi:hypothetical protein